MLVRVGVPIARQLQDAQVPVCAVAACADAHGRYCLDEVVAAGGVPEAYGLGGEIDFLGR